MTGSPTFLGTAEPLPLVDPTEAAALLGVERHTLACYRNLRNGPPYYKFGRWIRYLKTDLRMWAHRHGATVIGAERSIRRDRAYPEGLLETAAAATFLTLTPGWLVFCRFENIGPPHRRLGRRYFYSVDKLIDWADRQRVTA